VGEFGKEGKNSNVRESNHPKEVQVVAGKQKKKRSSLGWVLTKTKKVGNWNLRKQVQKERLFQPKLAMKETEKREHSMGSGRVLDDKGFVRFLGLKESA